MRVTIKVATTCNRVAYRRLGKFIAPIRKLLSRSRFTKRSFGGGGVLAPFHSDWSRLKLLGGPF
jgi:hypothetical protein